MPEERNDDRQHSHHGYDYYKGTRISSISPKRQKRGNCLHKGVYYRPKRKVWEAQIQISGEKQWLGYFKTFEDAVKAREEAEEKYFKPILDVRPPKEKRKEKLPGKNVINLLGYKGPHFTVVRYSGELNDKRQLWVCQCECGKEFLATSSQIREHKVISCGCTKRKPYTHLAIPSQKDILLDGTRLDFLRKQTPSRNNRSGGRGKQQIRKNYTINYKIYPRDESIAGKEEIPQHPITCALFCNHSILSITENTCISTLFKIIQHRSGGDKALGNFRFFRLCPHDNGHEKPNN